MKIELNTIYNMDCFDGMKLIPDGSVDLIVTDPPYVVKWGDGGSVNRIKKLSSSLKQLTDADIVNGYDILSFAKEVERLQGKEICAYFWCNKKQIPEYLAVYVGQMRCKFEIICWHKKNALPTYANKYLTDTEYCLYFHRGKGKTHPENYEDAKTYNVGLINHADKKLYNHPTIKPLPMIEAMIRNSGTVGGVVLDPFMGSGTTAIAAVKNGMKFIGFEINKEYYHTSIERIQKEFVQRHE